jgi:hypothetical protein
MLTQDRVRELFDYQDGKLVRKTHASSRSVTGTTVGWDNGQGYLRVGVDGKRYFVHTLIFLYHNGYIPENNIDHKDRCRANNRIENLRETSTVCNIRNTKLQSRNISGVKGVCWHNQEGKWRAQIVVNKKQHYLGLFLCFTEAVAHRLAAEQILNWQECDSDSSAFRHMQNYIEK